MKRHTRICPEPRSLTSGDIYQGSVEICQYRKCKKLIPKDRLKWNAKYCCRRHGLKEAALRRKEKREEEARTRRIQRRIKAAGHNKSHPDFFDVLFIMAKESLQNVGEVKFRLVWEQARSITRLKVNDHYMLWYKQKLETRLQKEITPSFHFKYKKKDNNGHHRYCRPDR